MPASEANVQRPYIIGLTGNIACGKSTVLRRLAELGAEVIDADLVVHALMEPGQPVWAAVREGFGPGVIAPDDRIDRRALAAIVFSDPTELQRLEELTHPAVRVRIMDQVAEAARRGVRTMVVDAIKLFEGGLADHCDEVWVVTCDPAQQLARLMARNGFDEAEARRRIAAQPPQSEKVARADVVIDNSGSLEATQVQVDAAWHQRVPQARSRRKGAHMATTEETTIRPAQPEDRSAIERCVETAYERYVERMGMRPAPMLADYAALIGSGVVWVLATPGSIGGILVMFPKGECLFIENVAVSPEFQGHGYGRRLIAFAEQTAIATGRTCLSLYTNALMTENLAYYPTLGFREVERRFEDGYRRVYMRKDLPPGSKGTDDDKH
jgi:dephospho-CoA kinase